ncbi:MAG: hypothetical protein V1859_11025 [archaeon]
MNEIKDDFFQNKLVDEAFDAVCNILLIKPLNITINILKIIMKKFAMTIRSLVSSIPELNYLRSDSLYKISFVILPIIPFAMIVGRDSLAENASIAVFLLLLAGTIVMAIANFTKTDNK